MLNSLNSRSKISFFWRENNAYKPPYLRIRSFIEFQRDLNNRFNFGTFEEPVTEGYDFIPNHRMPLQSFYDLLVNNELGKSHFDLWLPPQKEGYRIGARVITIKRSTEFI